MSGRWIRLRKPVGIPLVCGALDLAGCSTAQPPTAIVSQAELAVQQAGRAQAVESFLAQNGINPARIKTRGYGEAYRVASNNTEAGRQENRRVEIVILREGELAIDRMR